MLFTVPKKVNRLDWRRRALVKILWGQMILDLQTNSQITMKLIAKMFTQVDFKQVTCGVGGISREFINSDAIINIPGCSCNWKHCCEIVSLLMKPQPKQIAGSRHAESCTRHLKLAV